MPFLTSADPLDTPASFGTTIQWEVHRHTVQTAFSDLDRDRWRSPGSVGVLLEHTVRRNEAHARTYVETTFLAAHADVTRTESVPYTGMVQATMYYDEVVPARSAFAEMLFVALIPFMGLVEWLFPTQAVERSMRDLVRYSGRVDHTYVHQTLLDPFISTRIWPDEMDRYRVVEERRLGVAEYAWVPVRE